MGRRARGREEPRESRGRWRLTGSGARVPRTLHGGGTAARAAGWGRRARLRAAASAAAAPRRDVLPPIPLRRPAGDETRISFRRLLSREPMAYPDITSRSLSDVKTTKDRLGAPLPHERPTRSVRRSARSAPSHALPRRTSCTSPALHPAALAPSSLDGTASAGVSPLRFFASAPPRATSPT